MTTAQALTNLSFPILTTPINDIFVGVNALDTTLDLSNYFDDPYTTGLVANFQLSNPSIGNGVIKVVLFDQEGLGAPKTVQNFQNYVNSGSYENTIIHRSNPNFVIQGGGFTVDNLNLGIVTTNTPVENEFSPQRSNVRGTIAMAKLGNNPNSATSQWFFNLEDNSSNLNNQNGGFTVFGQVSSSNDLNTIDAIAAVPIYNASGIHPAWSDLPLIVDDPAQPEINRDDNFIRYSNITILQEEEIEYTIVSNSRPDLVTANINGQQLLLDYLPEQTGKADISLRGTNLFGEFVEYEFSVTVLPNSQSVTLAIAPTNALQPEGNEGLTPFTFTVTRTGDTSNTSTAIWAVTGTGENPANTEDFGGTLPTGTVTFAAGETSQVITVNVSGDTEVEQDETFTVSLSNPSNGIITTDTTTGTIQNDDTPPVESDRQQITSLDNLTVSPGGNVSIPLFYNTSTGDNTHTGISLRLHYNSNELTFQDVENLFDKDLFVNVDNLADSGDFDNNPNTDKFIQFGYADSEGNWPNQTLPLKLGDFNFTTSGNFAGTQLNVTSDNLAPGYNLEADPIFVGKQAWNLDIDGNGEIKALSDGIMIVRHLFGTFPGERLTEGAIAPNATRNLGEIQAYLQQGVDNQYLDVDGNGEIKALSDGIMIVRHLFGTFPGEKLIEGAISPDATRDLTQIQAYLTQFSTVV
ncbi:peptidylprolyl isomerase [Anabaenopsis arnoldii]|uniref:peptidylprolyl isomerase n=1 Tax=Anabaenopsis arnoldii TaxID=2152938 RepID=A0ABT5AUT3_9CYAN|nr:peptidylprolyl isomerase [Anabaenopsis arnoldii]MDB9541064.1 peptidylprolyl isomerase [Anabaenopsis arnoldii]MDH6093502.1 peptidylprolyl isomerase [Anabaenopsis arnoldii]